MHRCPLDAASECSLHAHPREAPITSEALVRSLWANSDLPWFRPTKSTMQQEDVQELQRTCPALYHGLFMLYLRRRLLLQLCCKNVISLGGRIDGCSLMDTHTCPWVHSKLNQPCVPLAVALLPRLAVTAPPCPAKMTIMSP